MNGDVFHQDVLCQLAEKFSLTIRERLTLGNICASVYRATSNKGSLVIKLGFTEPEQREIRCNQIGYSRLHAIGAKCLVPDPLEFTEVSGVPVIIMQDCGSDFWHAVQACVQPLSMYQRLVQELEGIYSLTLQSPQEAAISFHSLKELILTQYVEYLFPVFGRRDDLLRLLDRCQLELMAYLPKHSCFSTFDFTPEDVFLTPTGVKFADPLEKVVGIPVIDMACFAGVSRDAYGLPGAVQGYDVLRNFALTRIPEIIALDNRIAEALFSFGRALQCALSARFRIENNKAKSRELFTLSSCYCEEFARIMGIRRD